MDRQACRVPVICVAEVGQNTVCAVNFKAYLNLLPNHLTVLGLSFPLGSERCLEVLSEIKERRQDTLTVYAASHLREKAIPGLESGTKSLK